MTPGARLAAAIEILESIEAGRKPAAEALKTWGVQHRFAGSGDRAAIAGLVYDALRVRSSAAWLMGAETPRAVALGMLARVRDMDVEAIAGLCSGESHSPAPLDDGERARLADSSIADAPDHVRADAPEWLAEHLSRAFGDRLVPEGEALARRAPVDVRVNLLKTTRQAVLSALSHLDPEPAPLSPWGVRLPLGADGRGPALAAEAAFIKGMIEAQDEASQLAVLLTGAEPGWQVLDLCAGAGGKTLALAAMMGNRGQIFATDKDGARLAPIYKRIARAGVRNVQVRAPKGRAGRGGDALAGLEERCHLVLVDAPCTGSGVWRRNPDAKWRVRPGALEQRMKEQQETLDLAARYVRPGGRLAYVTCSVLCEENEDQVAAFLERDHRFAPLDAAVVAAACGSPELAGFASSHGPGFRLSPAASGTDGFYIAILSRVV